MPNPPSAKEDDLVIVSMHEKGFPQADCYLGVGSLSPLEFSSLGPAPDEFFTLARGKSLQDAIDRAKEKWPTAKVVVVEDMEEDDNDD